jgi:hypothetical protein
VSLSCCHLVPFPAIFYHFQSWMQTYLARFETDLKTVTDASTYPSRSQNCIVLMIPNRIPKTDSK